MEPMGVLYFFFPLRLELIREKLEKLASNCSGTFADETMLHVVGAPVNSHAKPQQILKPRRARPGPVRDHTARSWAWPTNI